MSLFLRALLEGVAFLAFIVLSVGVPGLLWLHHDWKHHKGWFR